MSRKCNWCFTLACFNSECNHDITTLPVMKEKPKNFVKSVLNSLTYNIQLGPRQLAGTNYIQYPHHHGIITFSSTAATVGQVKALLTSLGMNLLNDYCKPLASTRVKYAEYSYSEDGEPVLDAKLKRTFDEMSETGQTVTIKRFKKRLQQEYGSQFLIKNKQSIEIALPEMESPLSLLANIVDTISDETNFLNFNTCLNKWIENIKTTNIQTTHRAFINASRNDLQLSVAVINMIQWLWKRAPNTYDDIPMICYLGTSGCGKSWFLEQIKCYKQIATDAQGVGRYKLNIEKGYLLNEWTENDIFEITNWKTIKQLATGGHAVVKTFGDTIETKGWVVVCTQQMNLEEKNVVLNTNIMLTTNASISNEDIKAFKRRTLLVEFGGTFTDISYNCKFMWNEKMKYVIAVKCSELVNKIENETVLKLLNMYIKNLPLYLNNEECNKTISLVENL